MNREAMYMTLLGPVITEKATQASEHNQVTFRVRIGRPPSRRSRSGGGPLRGQGQGGQHACASTWQGKAVSRAKRADGSDVEEGRM